MFSYHLNITSNDIKTSKWSKHITFKGQFWHYQMYQYLKCHPYELFLLLTSWHTLGKDAHTSFPGMVMTHVYNYYHQKWNTFFAPYKKPTVLTLPQAFVYSPVQYMYDKLANHILLLTHKRPYMHVCTTLKYDNNYCLYCQGKWEDPGK